MKKYFVFLIGIYLTSSSFASFGEAKRRTALSTESQEHIATALEVFGENGVQLNQEQVALLQQQYVLNDLKTQLASNENQTLYTENFICVGADLAFGPSAGTYLCAGASGTKILARFGAFGGEFAATLFIMRYSSSTSRIMSGKYEGEFYSGTYGVGARYGHFSKKTDESEIKIYGVQGGFGYSLTLSDLEVE